MEKGHPLLEFMGRLKATLSKYCLNECELHRCCNDLRHFALLVDSDQLLFLYKEELEKQHPEASGNDSKLRDFAQPLISELSSEDRLVELYPDVFHYLGPICPRYDQKTKRCEIYGNPRKSSSCYKFPIAFVQSNLIVIDGRCEFTDNNWEYIFSGLEDACIKVTIRDDSPEHPFKGYRLPQDMKKAKERFIHPGYSRRRSIETYRKI
jgi:hypothetical protein